MQKPELYHHLILFSKITDRYTLEQQSWTLPLFKNFQKEGRKTVQVAMEVPCAEATVYRALKRVNQCKMKREIIFIDEETLTPEELEVIDDGETEE